MSFVAPSASLFATRASSGRARAALGGRQVSTCAERRRGLSTFVEDCRDLVENLVDGVGAGAYCPTSAPLLRTARWVTALARGLGKPGRRLDQRGKTEGRRGARRVNAGSGATVRNGSPR